MAKTPIKKELITIAAAGLILVQGVSSPAVADVLLIETIQQAPENSAAGLARPSRGMLMSVVEQTYGPALEKYAGVGNPPISRWKYAGFTVFFEHDHVVHSVVNRPSRP